MILAQLWAGLSDHYLHQVNAALEHMRAYLQLHYPLYQISAVICQRVAQLEDEASFGWDTSIVYWDPSISAREMELGRAWNADAKNLQADLWSLRHMEGAGQDRVSWRPQLLGDVPWHKTTGGQLMELNKIHDRLNMAIALSPSLEVVFALDRRVGQPSFTQRDVALFYALSLGLKPLVLRMALSHGLLEGQGRLSPREHETLRWLLRGLSEKEIAEELNLSYKTLHQYVVAVYRKFGVHSRAELMALWLEPRRFTR